MKNKKTKYNDSIRYVINKTASDNNGHTISLEKLVPMIHANKWEVEYKACADYFNVTLYNKNDDDDCFIMALTDVQLTRMLRKLKMLNLS